MPRLPAAKHVSADESCERNVPHRYCQPQGSDGDGIIGGMILGGDAVHQLTQKDGRPRVWRLWASSPRAYHRLRAFSEEKGSNQAMSPVIVLSAPGEKMLMGMITLREATVGRLLCFRRDFEIPSGRIAGIVATAPVDLAPMGFRWSLIYERPAAFHPPQTGNPKVTSERVA